MKFFSAQTRASATPLSQNSSMLTMMPLRVKPLIMQPPATQQVVVTVPPEKKIKWGEPTWFLFHTLSVKIKDSEFSKIRMDLLNQIYAICINLPCPDCANHARAYLDGINFNAIQTKTDLKKMLHAFHNELNRRKNYPLFPFDQIDDKYSKAITNRIIQNFMLHFSDRNRSIKLLPSDLYRQRLCVSLKEWFNDHISQFDT